ncbi:LysR family transcriptional regulator substrate-binding protein [Streptomyces sp. JCM17656]|nr:LysR family transcriptional regulator substrate-binding protein [Streptomyces sp. JCM17656]
MTGSEAPPPTPQAAPAFRLAYVPGVTPAKWVRVWQERFPDVPLSLHAATAAEASDLLREGGADAGFVRLPVDRTFFSAIPLYTETTVVVVPKDHVIAAVEEVTTEDLADEVVFHPSTTSSTGSGHRGARLRAARDHRGRRRAGRGERRPARRAPVAGPPPPPQGPHLPDAG